ncbi:hypothetical protein BpHYR1_010870 [Brachionus plicatilis]|uniref:Uncharacterized protein n=1 Tax=Brachionus plicatilis TaxID=10195 RepID=A0A3M7RV64_BRAPC|nr:hypothetical protein BpHYR1_010870 [Brachionus plicatilis]
MPPKKVENKNCILIRVVREQENLVLAELLNNNVLNKKPKLLISQVGEFQPTVTDINSGTWKNY